MQTFQLFFSSSISKRFSLFHTAQIYVCGILFQVTKRTRFSCRTRDTGLYVISLLDALPALRGGRTRFYLSRGLFSISPSRGDRFSLLSLGVEAGARNSREKRPGTNRKQSYHPYLWIRERNGSIRIHIFIYDDKSREAPSGHFRYIPSNFPRAWERALRTSYERKCERNGQVQSTRQNIKSQ